MASIPLKHKKFWSYVRRERVDIALLQETHLTDVEHSKLQQGGVGQLFFSSFSSSSRGVVILLRRTLPFQLLDCFKDKGSHYVIIKGLLHGEEIAIMNIYYFKSPN